MRCQYPVPWWDPAFNFTLGREPVNPRPVFYARVHDTLAPYTDGFISYSDGVNDDFNKALWTLKSWNPDASVRDITLDYTRFFFGAAVAERAADGLLALERNWEGPLAANGSVDGTLALWREIEAAAPELESNWRWQMHLMRAYYDAYTRHRLMLETRLEVEALDALAAAPGASAPPPRWTAPPRSSRARRPTTAARPGASASRRCARRSSPASACRRAWRSTRPAATSAARCSTSSTTRSTTAGGSRISSPPFARCPTRPRGSRRLHTLATWTRPGPGSFYDDVGNVAASPHVLRGDSLAPDDLAARRSDAALHVGRRPEPHAALVAHQHPLAQGPGLPAPGSRRDVSRSAQRDQAERRRATCAFASTARPSSRRGRRASAASSVEFAVPAGAREGRRHHADVRRHRRARRQLAAVLAPRRSLGDSAMKMDRPLLAELQVARRRDAVVHLVLQLRRSPGHLLGVPAARARDAADHGAARAARVGVRVGLRARARRLPAGLSTASSGGARSSAGSTRGAPSASRRSSRGTSSTCCSGGPPRASARRSTIRRRCRS